MGRGGPGLLPQSVLALNVTHRSPMGSFQRNYNFPRLQSGSNIFQRGGGGGGVQLLIPDRTQMTSYFPGSGFGPPVPSLDPRMKTHSSDVLFMV